MTATALVILARAPVHGTVKSRLAADVGTATALCIYRDLLARTAGVAAEWPGPVLLLAEGDERAWAGTGFATLPRRPQAPGDLGARIAGALHAGLGLARRAVVVGSDSAELDCARLQVVVDLLDTAPVAFGPATDGGFWAIATSTAEVAAALTTAAIPWSTPSALAATRAWLTAHGFAAATGPEASDIDTLADYEAAVARGRLPDRRGAARPRTTVIIPVLNEEQALPAVLTELPRDCVDEVIVVDNGSTDRSAAVAMAHGARVVREPRRGYGAACLAGIEASVGADIVAFLDGDHSDHPDDLRALIAPILAGTADLVIGSRMLDAASRRALLPQARFGNRLAAFLLRRLFGIRCSDLGPFRVVRRSALQALGMQDRDYGWTVEMQIRARLAGLRVVELPVRYRERIGKSKITGTLRGTLGAGSKILRTILGYRLWPPRLPRMAAPR